MAKPQLLLAANILWWFVLLSFDRINEPGTIASFMYLNVLMVVLGCLGRGRVFCMYTGAAVVIYLVEKVMFGYQLAGQGLPITALEASVLLALPTLQMMVPMTTHTNTHRDRKIKKILYIRVGTFSHANQSILDQLRRKFPDYLVDEWNLTTTFKENPLVAARAYAEALSMYGPHKPSMSKLLTTGYAFHVVKQWAQERIAADDYAFTYQTQSLFDTSVPGVPHFVHTDHAHLTNLLYPGYDRRNLRPGAYIVREQTIYDNATLIFTFGEHVTRSITRDYFVPFEKVVTVGGGPNSKLDENAPPKDDRYARQNILFVGIDWVRKGGPLLVEAFYKVRAQFPHATLTIVGSAPSLADTTGIEIVGRVPLEQVAQYYQQASIFCMPTRYEPFGTAFLEAMHARLPIVASRLGALPEFVSHGESGYLAPVDDVDVLADSLCRLLEDPGKCRKFGSVGYDRVMEKFTWDHVGDRVYEHITRHMMQIDE